MYVVAFHGSPKPYGNTARALETALAPLIDAGVNCEIICVGKHTISGCLACGWCKKNPGFRCIQDKDPVNEWLQKMKAADAVLLAAPVYFGGIPGAMKSFLDRAFFVNSCSGSLLRMKPAAAITVARRTGSLCALDGLHHYLNYAEMPIVGSYYWNVAFGHRPGEVLTDTEGTQILTRLGENLLYMLNMRKAFTEPLPIGKPRQNYNYIR